jgi:hypothetical protein
VKGKEHAVSEALERPQTNVCVHTICDRCASEDIMFTYVFQDDQCPFSPNGLYKETDKEPPWTMKNHHSQVVHNDTELSTL